MIMALEYAVAAEDAAVGAIFVADTAVAPALCVEEVVEGRRTEDLAAAAVPAMAASTAT